MSETTRFSTGTTNGSVDASDNHVAPASRRNAHGRDRSLPCARAGSKMIWHGSQLSHLSRCRPSRGCLSPSVAPRSTHPRLDDEATLEGSPTGASHLHHSTHFLTRHPSGTGL